MKIFFPDADGGTVKVYNDTIVLLFNNGVGDFPVKVVICEPSDYGHIELTDPIMHELESAGEMIDEFFFDIKTEAYLSNYDCHDNRIYVFPPGRYTETLYENLIYFGWTPLSSPERKRE